jgi:Mannosyl-glycoprotein endo-beta-N-acetylglucosaminidase
MTIITLYFVALVITLIWATISSGAATVPSVSPAAGRAPVEVAGVSAPTACPTARQGLRFYQARARYWAHRMGAGTEWAASGSRPRSCPRYLANLWRDKAHAWRKRSEAWWEAVGAVVRRLERGLQGTPMEGTGAVLERYGRKYGVSPFFMVAAAATESSIGAAACGPGGYNAWGLGNCGSAWSVPSFSSWSEAIAYYARFLARGWPGHSTPYSFSGYAACDECWGRKVSEWMSRLFGVRAVTRYP